MAPSADWQLNNFPISAREGGARKKRTAGKESKGAQLWTKDDDAFIRCHCETMTDTELGTALGRSRDAVVQRRLRTLQITKRGSPGNWTAEDLAMLRTLYGEVDTLFLAAVLGYSVRRLRQHALRLGLRTPRSWSPQEDEILRQHFPSSSLAEFVDLLPGRSLQGIYGRASTLSLSRGLPYLLSNWRHSKFHMYPPELQSLIRLHRQVERKLQNVQAQH